MRASPDTPMPPTQPAGFRCHQDSGLAPGFLAHPPSLPTSRSLRSSPGALDYSRPARRGEFAPVYPRFVQWLKSEHPSAAARMSLIKVLELAAVLVSLTIA